MKYELCLCVHSAEDHMGPDGPCKKCSCSKYSYDPFLEIDPYGRIVASLEMGVTGGEDASIE